MTTYKLIVKNSKQNTDFDNLSYEDYPIDSAIPALIFQIEKLYTECPAEERESETWKVMACNLNGMLYTRILEDEPTDEELDLIHTLVRMGKFEEKPMEVIAVILSNLELWNMKELKEWVKING